MFSQAETTNNNNKEKKKKILFQVQGSIRLFFEYVYFRLKCFIGGNNYFPFLRKELSHQEHDVFCSDLTDLSGSD